MSLETSVPAGSGDVLPRFSVKPYTPDGGFNAGGVMMLISALVLVGGVLGFAAHWVSQFFYLIFLFPAGIGFVLGAAGIRMVRQGRVRNPWIGALAGFLGGALAMSMMHYFDYREFMEITARFHPDIRELAKLPLEQRAKQLPADMKLDDREKVLLAIRMASVNGILDYMNFEAEQGVRIGKATSSTDKGLNLGFWGSWIYWLVELLIVAFITLAMVHESTTAPYCSSCDQWKTAKTVGTFADPAAAVAAVNSGDLNVIRAAMPAVPGPVHATLACCDSCQGQGAVDLKLELVTFDKKNNKQTQRLAHATYPPEALPPLLALFAAPPVPPAPAAEASTST